MSAGPAIEAVKAYELAARIRPLLAGHAPAVQSAALAGAMASFLRGYHGDGREATHRLRGVVLSCWLETVRELVLAEDDVAGHA
jgi:hypothetical protein